MKRKISKPNGKTQKIYNYLNDNNCKKDFVRISYKELVTYTGISISTLKLHIDYMVKNRIITKWTRQLDDGTKEMHLRIDKDWSL